MDSGVFSDGRAKEVTMATHPLVTQLRFARSEFRRCLDGVSPEDAARRLGPLNCISWIVGHLANQEHFLWATWHTVTQAADEFLDTVTSEQLQGYM
jgi:hypothetical protein